MRAFGFAFVVAIGCGLLFGLVPALRRERTGFASALRGSRGSYRGLGGTRGLADPEQLLVVAQTSFALLLLVTAALFPRSRTRELAVPLGFDSVGVHVARVSLPARYTPPLRLQLVEQLEERLAGIASVEAVAIASDIPLAGGFNAARLWLPEREETIRYYRHSVGADFFDVLGIQLVEGRAFTAADHSWAPAVAAVGTSRQRDASGRPRAPSANVCVLTDGSEVEVVAVVGDVRYRDLRTSLSTTEPDVYFPLTQRPASDFAIAIRSGLPPASILRREAPRSSMRASPRRRCSRCRRSPHSRRSTAGSPRWCSRCSPRRHSSSRPSGSMPCSRIA